MKILITGCAGLIGAHLSRHLIEKNHKVFGIDNLSGGYLENLPKDLTFFNLDLIEHDKVETLFKENKFDIVYHLAAYAAEGLSRYILRHNCNTNILASMNVINSCVNTEVKKLIYTSSMAVYGKQKVPYTEDMIPQPDDPYGASKYFVEMILQQSKEHFGLDYSILRPHNVIGIYQNIWDRYRNVIGIWIRNIFNYEPLTIFGDGEQTRAFSDIKYCLSPFESLISHSGEVYNIGSDKFHKIKDVAEILLKIAGKFGYTTRIVYKEARNEVKNAFCDHGKASKNLNFKDETDLEKSIKEMFSWAQAQKNHEIKKISYEISKNMYPSWK